MIGQTIWLRASNFLGSEKTMGPNFLRLISPSSPTISCGREEGREGRGKRER